MKTVEVKNITSTAAAHFSLCREIGDADIRGAPVQLKESLARVSVPTGVFRTRRRGRDCIYLFVAPRSNPCEYSRLIGPVFGQNKRFAIAIDAAREDCHTILHGMSASSSYE